MHVFQDSSARADEVYGSRVDCDAIIQGLLRVQAAPHVMDHDALFKSRRINRVTEDYSSRVVAGKLFRCLLCLACVCVCCSRSHGISRVSEAYGSRVVAVVSVCFPSTCL